MSTKAADAAPYADAMIRALALAVDVGGTKVEAALVDDRGRLVPGSRHRRPTGALATSVELDASVQSAVEAARAALPADASLAGVGVGCAGPVDVERGLVSPLNLVAWRDHPLVASVAAVVPEAPVTLRIDGLCIALAEHWVGAGRDVPNLLGMIVSTGVGGGLVLGGRAAPSPTGNGGHIGHIEVGGFDDACACGGRGCLEAVASGPRTVAWARTQGFTGETGEDLALAHAAGDPIAVAAVARAGDAIGHAVASAASLLDLDVVAIGGGFSRVSPALFEHARAAVAERRAFSFVSRVRIVPSGLSDEGPLIGAAALVHQPEFLA
jgi:predicted NBD/HSP70 family sugar kinase